MPLEPIAELLRMRYDLEASVASRIAMEEGVGDSVDPTYRELGEELRVAERTRYAGGDETGMPAGGRTEWLRVGSSPRLTVHRIRKGRGGKEAATIGTGYRGKRTHDGLDVDNSVRELRHQTDLVDSNRWQKNVEASHGRRTRDPLFERGGPRYLYTSDR